jgi:hypothetical protein
MSLDSVTTYGGLKQIISTEFFNLGKRPFVKSVLIASILTLFCFPVLCVIFAASGLISVVK